MEDLKSDIVSKIRSCLISTKGRVTLRQLEDDYRTLLGERIPYAKLGHKSLDSFIQTVPTLVTCRGPNGEILVDAKVNEKTAHISTMVQKQKSVSGGGAKKKVRIARFPPRFASRPSSHAPPPATPRWRPKKYVGDGSYQQRKVENSPRLAAISHNQFVSGKGYNRRAKVPSKIVVPEHSEFNNVRKSSLSPSPPPPNRELKRFNSSPEKLIHENNVNSTRLSKIVVNENNLEAATNGEDCSPLSSTMKRLSKIMSGISLERDSGNSSPTAEYVNFKLGVQEFVKTGDPIVDLKSFAAYHKLGDVDVMFTETKSKKSKVAQCHCKITVGQHKYSSYPADFFDRSEAEKHASQKALDELMLKYSKRRSLLLSSIEDIMARIPPMLEKHNSAVWMWQIEADYIDRYNEQLPSDWLQIIDNSPSISIEKCLGGYVLKHCNPNDKGKKVEAMLSLGDVSIPCNSVDFGESNRLYAVVTAAHASNEVWCQQCGTPEYEKFVQMTERMERFYANNRHELAVTSVNPGSCYVIYHEGGWIRVRALGMAQENMVDCFLIDYGEEIHVMMDNVFILKREFALEQAQAFVCRLDGLDDFYEVSVESEHLLSLIGREVVLEIVVDEPSSDDDITFPVVMYDVTTGKSINEQLISWLAIESAMAVLDKSVITEVYVSNIESNGDVYVQVRTLGFYRLQDCLNELTRTFVRDPPSFPPPSRDSAPDRIYLIRDKFTQKFVRTKIIDWSPKGDLAQIYYVDVGSAHVVNVAKETMLPLDKIDDVVNQYPPQAIKVRIMVEKIPEDFVQRAERLLPRDQPVMLKIGSYDNEGVAWVEFFKRTNDDVLVFVNKSITVEAELQNSDVAVNNNEISRKRLINLVQYGEGTKNVPSGGSLRKPDLPKIGDYFNVNIPFSVNPWNFFVQPLDSFNQLTALMADMQEYYKDLQFSPMPIEDITPGRIYASKHDDGSWYRTSVLKVIHSGSISVYYCDFGYYTSLTLAQLVPLDPKYMGFPYQALKAKIAGIKPMKDKWTMEDCDLFNSLVMKKHFVSILVNIEKDELHKSDMILQLLLIDTSSDEDVNIKEVLIERGIAKSV